MRSMTTLNGVVDLSAKSAVLKKTIKMSKSWYNMRYDNCTSAHQTLLNGRENHLIHSVRQDAGNLLRGTRGTDEGVRVCTTP